MKKLLITLATAGALVLPALADYYVAGDFNGWSATGNLMTETTPGSGIWQATDLNVGSGRHEFKITDGTWDTSYPGPNSWLVADASGVVSISFDVNSYSDG